MEQIIGLINVEHVQLQAEAYDVALDISFPKGNYYTCNTCTCSCYMYTVHVI